LSRTSNICERLFSVTKMILSDRRKSLEPFHPEEDYPEDEQKRKNKKLGSEPDDKDDENKSSGEVGEKKLVSDLLAS
jgi:hypothetical protein